MSQRFLISGCDGGLYENRDILDILKLTIPNFNDYIFKPSTLNNFNKQKEETLNESCIPRIYYWNCLYDLGNL